jgi:hypothetical protein
LFLHNGLVSVGRIVPLLILSVLATPPVRTVLAGPKVKAVTDPDYISALSVANRFLAAWQTRDHEAGLLMLTDDAKKHTTEDRLSAFFSENGHQQGFLISNGKKIRSGCYEFPVALMESAGRSVHRRFSHITVIRTGKDEWAVDTLP